MELCFYFKESLQKEIRKKWQKFQLNDSLRQCIYAHTIVVLHVHNNWTAQTLCRGRLKTKNRRQKRYKFDALENSFHISGIKSMRKTKTYGKSIRNNIECGMDFASLEIDTPEQRVVVLKWIEMDESLLRCTSFHSHTKTKILFFLPRQ